MLEPIRRGRLQLPPGQIHGTSFNISSAEVPPSPGGQAVVRLSALLAAFVLIWTLVTETTVDTAESAFIAAMLGFTWHAGVHITWDSRR
ncbi:hypothetical protein [Streptomyces zhihengii]|uniref:Uncharacterized protein n=1 Tax=Streptomyces zhihengii TaxID=1818004 RepID=A0ABS2V5C0_9ACTN|nr:hypothetical protein [Streptomyces zhihengii]MBM9624654.1 hypothetical protein [Streptomyces zhihengii]